MKDREERRRLRTVAWLSNSLEGAVREPDTESDDERDGKSESSVFEGVVQRTHDNHWSLTSPLLAALRIPSKLTKGGATPPVIAGMAGAKPKA